MKIVFLYSIIVIFASLVNIFFQRMTLEIFPTYLILAMLMGTGTGVLTKYILDAKYVFKYQAPDLNEHVRVVAKYGFMGLFTTGIFWSIELVFHYFVPIRESAMWGAALGLTLGSAVKYYLDKNYVFGPHRKDVPS